MVTRDPAAFNNTSLKNSQRNKGEYNVVLGSNDTGGYGETYNGSWPAMYLTGTRTTVVGNQAGGGLTSAGYNTMIGFCAGVGNTSYTTSTGGYNTYIGTATGQSSSTQRDHCTAVGGFALVNGNYATVLGYGASAGAAGAVAIGSSAAGTGASTTVADEIALGTAEHTVKTSGGVRKAIVAKTTTYAAAKTDHIINATSGTFNVTLPTAVSDTGREFIVKNSGTGVITLDTTSSQTIDGATTRTLNQYDSLTVVSDGSNWIVI